MKKSKRQGLILQRVQAAPPTQLLRTSELAQEFAVSETTIRRDFQALAEDGLILRQYGGAKIHSAPASAMLGQIGILIVPRIDKYRDPFFNMVLEGLDRALENLSYQIAFVKTLHEIDSTAQARLLLDSFAVKGLILLGSADSQSVVYLRRHFSPIVTVADNFDIEDDTVLFDGERGMRLMVRHLAKLGYRRLGYISGYRDIRYAGFCQGLRRWGLPHDESLRQILKPSPAGWTPDLGERGARILMSIDDPPDAIVCASDLLAIGAMGWLQRNGYRVPKDIAVTGFDNIPDSEFAFPPLSTVRVQKLRLGAIAAERLARRIANPHEPPLKIVTPTSLVIRQSCGGES